MNGNCYVHCSSSLHITASPISDFYPHKGSCHSQDSPPPKDFSVNKFQQTNRSGRLGFSLRMVGSNTAHSMIHGVIVSGEADRGVYIYIGGKNKRGSSARFSHVVVIACMILVAASYSIVV